MIENPLGRLIIRIYVLIFFAYLFVPLIIMGGAALNDTKFPSVYPWVGLTGRWFVDLWNDGRMWSSTRNTVLVALAVVAISLPIGTAAAILINNLARPHPIVPLRRHGGSHPHARHRHRHLDPSVLEQHRQYQRACIFQCSVSARSSLPMSCFWYLPACKASIQDWRRLRLIWAPPTFRLCAASCYRISIRRWEPPL